MIPHYLIVAGRIRQEVSNLETTVNRAERAIAAARGEESRNRVFAKNPVSGGQKGNDVTSSQLLRR